jgi:hypothetical protein
MPALLKNIKQPLLFFKQNFTLFFVQTVANYNTLSQSYDFEFTTTTPAL